MIVVRLLIADIIDRCEEKFKSVDLILRGNRTFYVLNLTDVMWIFFC